MCLLEAHRCGFSSSLCLQIQRSLRRHDTQLTRILDDDEINAGKAKKAKGKPAATASS